MLCWTLSGDVYFFVPNIVQLTLHSEQHSLFDVRDYNKSNQTYVYKGSVRCTTVSAFLFSGPFYPSRVDYITPTFWGNMDHQVGVYFSLYFLNKRYTYSHFKRHIACYSINGSNNRNC